MDMYATHYTYTVSILIGDYYDTLLITLLHVHVYAILSILINQWLLQWPIKDILPTFYHRNESHLLCNKTGILCDKNLSCDKMKFTLGSVTFV